MIYLIYDANFMAFSLRFGFLLSYFDLLWRKGSKNEPVFVALALENSIQISFSLK